MVAISNLFIFYVYGMSKLILLDVYELTRQFDEFPKSSLIRRAFFLGSTITPLATATLLTDVEGDDVDDEVDVGSRFENGVSPD